MSRLELLFAILALSAVSCSKGDVFPEVSGKYDTLFATMEQGGSEADTKVYLGEDIKFHWNAGDNISFFNKEMYNYQYVFKGEDGDRSGEFDKVKTVFHSKEEIEHVYAVYPYSRSTSISDEEVLTIILPSEQEYAVNSTGPGANTMVSAGDDENLYFRNVCGYICFKLCGEGVKVSSVTLQGNGNEIISGSANVTMEPGGYPEATMSDGGGSGITVSCPSPVSLDPLEPVQFWFVVPPVSFSSGFSITVKDPEGRTFVKSTSKSFDIRRNVITRIAPIEVIPE